MKQIENYNPHNLRNEEHFQLMSDIKTQIATETPEKLAITTEFSAFEQTLEVEGNAIQGEQGSVITKPLVDADAYRDQLHKGLETNFDSFTYHYDEAKREAARKLTRLFAQYGNLRIKPYNEESAALTALVRELTTTYLAENTLLGGVEWTAKVEEANNNFIALFNDRNNEMAARTMGNVRETRAAVDPAFQEVVNAINYLAKRNEALYGGVIDRINQLISYHKTTLATRKGRAAKAGEQTATGQN
jgi:hypothetical protein